jgi:hypothetical protein
MPERERKKLIRDFMLPVATYFMFSDNDMSTRINYSMSTDIFWSFIIIMIFLDVIQNQVPVQN